MQVYMKMVLLLIIIEVHMKDLKSIAKIFTEEADLFLIDHYPFVVEDNDKYSQVEYDFNFMSKKRYKRKQTESAVKEFFEFLWLYSDLKVYIFDVTKKMNRKDYNKEQTVLVDDIKLLKKIIRMRMKNKVNAFFVFEKFRGDSDIYLYLDDVFVSAYFTASEQVSDIEIIASHCGLFMRRK